MTTDGVDTIGPVLITMQPPGLIVPLKVKLPAVVGGVDRARAAADARRRDADRDLGERMFVALIAFAPHGRVATTRLHAGLVPVALNPVTLPTPVLLIVPEKLEVQADASMPWRSGWSGRWPSTCREG